MIILSPALVFQYKIDGIRKCPGIEIALEASSRRRKSLVECSKRIRHSRLWKGRKVRSDNELFRELQRLNKTGIINDEEYLVLKKIIAGGKVSPEFYRQFDRLFAGNSKSAPVETEKKKSAAQKQPVQKEERLYSIDEAINELNLKLTTLGGFDHSRQLLNCPACGMFEAITNQGTLITVESDYPEDDTGLRFTKVNEGDWECPDCAHLCRENSPETLHKN